MITLPLLGRTTTFILLMTLTSYFQMFAQFHIFAPKEGPQQSGLVMTGYIYKQAFVNKEMGYAAALSMALFVVILAVSGYGRCFPDHCDSVCLDALQFV